MGPVAEWISVKTLLLLLPMRDFENLLADSSGIPYLEIVSILGARA